MKILNVMTIFALLVFIISCMANDVVDEKIKNEYPESLSLTASNETNLLQTDETIILDAEQLKTKASGFNLNTFVIYGK